MCVHKYVFYLNIQMDDQNEIQYNNIISEINKKTGLDYQLKEDLVEAVEECRDFVVSNIKCKISKT